MEMWVQINGHCVTFPPAVDEPAHIFPWLLQEIKIIRIRRQCNNNTHDDFIVRRERVKEDLQWWQKINAAYSDFKIFSKRLYIENYLILKQYIISHQLLTLVTMEQHQSKCQLRIRNNAKLTLEFYSSTQCRHPEANCKQAPTLTMAKKHTFLPKPSKNYTPVSEFTTQYFFTLAFPCLFPFAHGDFFLSIGHERVIHYQNGRNIYFGWQMACRFACHQYFKFIVHPPKETDHNFKKLSELNHSTSVAHITATYDDINIKSLRQSRRTCIWAVVV